MGRRRIIDRDAMLDAAQAVVLRDGAAHLTLEAVAAQAGISKASVLYDYKTKQALVRAVIVRRIEEYRRKFDAIQRELGPVPDARIRTHIREVMQSPTDEDRAVAVNLCAATAQDTELREPIQELLRIQIAALLETSGNARGALLAFLALEGLRHLEWFGFHAWSGEERDRLLAEITWLSSQEPESSVPNAGPQPV